MNLPEYIKSITNITPEAEAEITQAFKREVFPKGHHLFRSGDTCHHVYYIEQGLARTYSISKSGKEITAWFYTENNFTTAIDSFYCQKPSSEDCELLENSVIYSIPYSELAIMLNKELQWSKFAFHVVFDMAKQMVEFTTSLKFLTAEERYHMLVEKYPSILQRAPLGHIASYLGITQETLSRIRSGR